METNYYSWLYKFSTDSKEFKEEDHPRETSGTHGGQFRKSNKTIAEEDTLKPSKSESEEEKTDREYMEAVKKGDMEKAQRMVNEAAAKAFSNTKVKDKDGKPLIVYHTTDRDFTEFHTPSFFATTKEATEGIKGFSLNSKTMAVFLNIKTPRKIDAGGDKWSRIYIPDEGFRSLNGIVRGMESNGWRDYLEGDIIVNVDGLIVSNVREGDGGRFLTTDYVPKDPSQIKSADPVTYDDEGNVIPLSKRFDKGPDIRGDISK